MNIQIITDSATDLPEWIRHKYNIPVIPTPVVINGIDYFDGTTIKSEQFYDILRGKANVTTYHINQHMFFEAFLPFARKKQEVIYFCFSTGIAGTFNAAHLAKEEIKEEYPDFNITIVDSKSASIGFGIVVYFALQMQENGASKEQILEAARFHFDHMEHIFTVESLEYLQKGGRISKTAAIAGGLLDIKPIIEVTDEGKLAVFEKVRGRQKAIKRLVEVVGERGISLDKQQLALVHADCAHVMNEAKEMLQSKYGCRSFLETSLGCAIGAHTGPGLLGVCFLNTDSPFRRWLNPLS